MRKIIGGLICLVLAGAFLCAGIVTLRKKHEVAACQETDGIVIRSEVASHVKTEKNKKTTMYQPLLVYQYTVNGAQHTGDKYTYTTVSSSNREWAEGIVAKYPVRAQCKVYYSADDPSQSVLVKNPGGMHAALPWIFIAIGGVVLVVCVSVAVIGSLVMRQAAREEAVIPMAEVVSDAAEQPAGYAPARPGEPPPPPEDEGS